MRPEELNLRLRLRGLLRGEESLPSDREIEVGTLLAQGLQLKEIGARLNLETKTVDVHKTNLMRKAGLHCRIDVVWWAVREGLIKCHCKASRIECPCRAWQSRVVPV